MMAKGRDNFFGNKSPWVHGKKFSRAKLNDLATVDFWQDANTPDDHDLRSI